MDLGFFQTFSRLQTLAALPPRFHELIPKPRRPSPISASISSDRRALPFEDVNGESHKYAATLSSTPTGGKHRKKCFNAYIRESVCMSNGVLIKVR